MLSPEKKHQLIMDLTEARYTLTHLVNKTPDERRIEDELDELILHVLDMQVEGE